MAVVHRALQVQRGAAVQRRAAGKNLDRPRSASWLTTIRLAPPSDPASQPVASETPPR